MKSKICGISDSKTLNYLTTHPNPPQYIGFIVNYPKSKRFVELNKLKDLLKVDKKNSIILHSQISVENFYKSLKFISYGKEFTEDGILHIAMKH